MLRKKSYVAKNMTKKDVNHFSMKAVILGLEKSSRRKTNLVSAIADFIHMEKIKDQRYKSLKSSILENEKMDLNDNTQNFNLHGNKIQVIKRLLSIPDTSVLDVNLQAKNEKIELSIDMWDSIIDFESILVLLNPRVDQPCVN